MVEVNHRRRHIRFLIAVLCFMLALGNSEALVLCIGQDGHVAVEASDSGCCGHLSRTCCPDDAHCLFTAGSCAHDDDCGVCLDIPLSSGTADALQAPNEVRPDLPACDAIDPSRVACCDFPESPADLKSLTPLSDFPPPRSTILLI